MNRLVAVLMLICTGCATAQPVRRPPLIAANRRPESRAMPQDPRTEELPRGVPRSPGENAVDAIEQGVAAPRSGILVSEARAARDAIFRLRYTEIRRLYEADRQVWTAHRALYEEQIRRDRQALQAAQPDWWERHDATVVGVIAFIVGAALTVGLAAALDAAIGR